MTRQRRTRQRGLEPGQLVGINLAGSTAYGRLLAVDPYMAFYATEEAVEGHDLSSVILSLPLLFVVAAVYQEPIESGRWEPLGVRPFMELEVQIPKTFNRSPGPSGQSFSIIDSNGDFRPATPQECLGLERFRVWTANEIESRILDSLLGRVSPLVEVYGAGDL